jgi:hypothetical protein
MMALTRLSMPGVAKAAAAAGAAVAADLGAAAATILGAPIMAVAAVAIAVTSLPGEETEVVAGFPAAADAAVLPSPAAAPKISAKSYCAPGNQLVGRGAEALCVVKARALPLVMLSIIRILLSFARRA